MRLQKLSLPDVEAVQGRLGAIAAAEGITEEDAYRWAQEVRAVRFAEREKDRKDSIAQWLNMTR